MAHYLLLDAARMESALSTAKELAPDHVSLYRGRSEEGLAAYSPYLFPLEEAASLVEWVYENGWGKSWGIFVKSKTDKRTIYKHFRQFLMIAIEYGEEVYFRFYDPRVLRVFLPTCDTAQLIEFFGPVQYFFMEDEDPAFGLQFGLENGQLKTSRVVKADIEQIIS